MDENLAAEFCLDLVHRIDKWVQSANSLHLYAACCAFAECIEDIGNIIIELSPDSHSREAVIERLKEISNKAVDQNMCGKILYIANMLEAKLAMAGTR